MIFRACALLLRAAVLPTFRRHASHCFITRYISRRRRITSYRTRLRPLLPALIGAIFVAIDSSRGLYQRQLQWLPFLIFRSASHTTSARATSGISRPRGSDCWRWAILMAHLVGFMRDAALADRFTRKMVFGVTISSRYYRHIADGDALGHFIFSGLRVI